MKSGPISILYAQNTITVTRHSASDTFLTYGIPSPTQNSGVWNISYNRTGNVIVGNFTEDVTDASQLNFTQGTITAIDRAAKTITVNHPNFIRPATASAYTGLPAGGNNFINPAPSSIVFLSDDAGVALSGNIVSGAGPFTQNLVKANAHVTKAAGLAGGIVQVDSLLDLRAGL